MFPHIFTNIIAKDQHKRFQIRIFLLPFSNEWVPARMNVISPGHLHGSKTSEEYYAVATSYLLNFPSVFVEASLVLRILHSPMC